ncbi:MAG: hypothetical protein H6841_01895 [Planctomycetes bacterium]|nr:hypothetical protein [Planctomycetota bacterium]
MIVDAVKHAAPAVVGISVNVGLRRPPSRLIERPQAILHELVFFRQPAHLLAHKPTQQTSIRSASIHGRFGIR